MASTYARITPSSNGNRKTWTFSAWVKRSNTNENDTIFSSGNSTDVEFFLRINTGNAITVYNSQFGINLTLTTNRLFRDNNAWYHIVFTLDTTQATASDRAKLYVNGVQETSFLSSTYPSQNADLVLPQTSTIIDLGRRSTGSNQHFNGLMSHVHFCDGYAYSPTDFGEYDANGVWTIKTSPSVSYGTWGFFVLKDGNSVTDQSGNGNDLTVGGTALTNTEDNPSNVFATLNAIEPPATSRTYSNGNLTVEFPDANVCTSVSTLGMSKGKYYFEAKLTAGSSGNPRGIVGICYNPYIIDSNGQYIGASIDAGSIGYYAQNGNVLKADTTQYTGSAFDTGDIIGVALDLDNYYIYFSKNGTWQNSGDPTSGATGTGGVSTDNPADRSGFYFFGVGDTSGVYGQTFSVNFGNGYFGTTAVASAGTNASGIGIFEYDVPTGYTALSTKGLNL